MGNVVDYCMSLDLPSRPAKEATPHVPVPGYAKSLLLGVSCVPPSPYFVLQSRLRSDGKLSQHINHKELHSVIPGSSRDLVSLILDLQAVGSLFFDPRKSYYAKRAGDFTEIVLFQAKEEWKVVCVNAKDYQLTQPESVVFLQGVGGSGWRKLQAGETYGDICNLVETQQLLVKRLTELGM